MLTVSSALFVEKANAHGAWLGNCVVDFSQSTKNAYQIIDSDNDGVADALGSPIGDGDFIEYQASCPVIVDGTDSGPGGWVTFYVPEGSRIANAWITDSQGNAVDARKALGGGNGISGGWGPKGELTFDVSSNGWQPENTTACDDAGYTGNNKKCNAGLAFTYGDTGIFYSTRSDTAMYTGDSSKKITLSNGYLIQPSNNKPWASIGGSGNARTHNKWDAVQSNAFGSKDPLSNNGFTTSEETYLTPDGRGSTPFNTGSPVAGPDSGVTWDRYGTTGPWQRIKYSGSCFAGDPSNAPANSAGAVEGQGEVGVNSVEVCSETSAGFDLASGGDASFLPSATNAVRFAFGGLAENETYYFKVRLKVNDAENLGYANFESSGGDSAEGIKGGNDNPWRYWVGAVGSIDPTVAIIDEIQKTNTGDGLSVRFDSQSCGFVGKFGTNAQKLLDLTQLSTLGITRSSFSQNLGDRSSSFQLQGNDIPGTLSLFYESGGAEQSLKFNGAIVWQDKANGKTFGFGFVPAVGVDVTLSGYNIVGIAANNGKRTNSSNFFLCANGQEANFPTVGAGDDYSGSADPPLTELNAYLNSSESQQAPTIVTSVSDSTKAEATDLVHTVTLSGSPAADVTFAYDLTDVSATGDTDYTVAPTFSSGVTLSDTTLTIPAGVTSFTITYSSLGDTIVEDNETYVLQIGGVTGTGTITDNSPPVAVDDTNTVTQGSTLTVANGNAKDVLVNDTDSNSDALTATAIRTGAEGDAGASGTIGQALPGIYGALTLNADGSYTYVASAQQPTNTLLSETFTYTASDGNGGADTAEIVITVLVPAQNLAKSAMLKTDADSSGDVSKGDILTYTLTATNIGNVVLTNVVITDAALGLIASGCSTSLATGASCSVTGDYEVTQSDADAGKVANSASVTADNASNATAAIETIVNQPSQQSGMCTSKADLWFAMDESGSVTNDEFDDGLNFVYAVSDLFKFDNVTGAKAGIIGWSNDPQPTSVIIPITDQFSDLDDTGLIGSLSTDSDGQGVRDLYVSKVSSGRGTRLDLATQRLADLINAGNGRRDGVPSVAVILTDANQGQLENSNEGGGDAWITAAANLRNAGPDGTQIIVMVIDDTITNGDRNAAKAYNDSTLSKTIVDTVAGSVENVFVGSTYAVIADPAKGYISGLVDKICDAAVVSVSANPALEVTKTASGTTSLGDVITYTILVTNTGNVTVDTIELTDTFTDAQGAALTLTTDPVFGGTTKDNNPGPNNGAAGRLVPGETATYTATYQITQAAIDAGGVKNVALAVGKDPSDVSVSDTSDDGDDGDDNTIDDPTETLLVATPELTVTKTALSTGYGVGDVITYTILVTNTGNVTVDTIELTDTFTDAQGAALALTTGPSFVKNSGASAEKTLAPSETATYTATYQITQAAIDAGGVKNVALAAGTDPSGAPVEDTSDNGNEGEDSPGDADDDPTNDPTETPLSKEPSQTISKKVSANADEDASGDISLGDSLTYTVTATNIGNITLTEMVVVDMKLSPNSTTCDSVTPGASCLLVGTYSVTQENVDAGVITNLASVVSAEIGELTETELQTLIQRRPALAIEKMLTSTLTSNVNVDDELSYRIVAKNIGNQTLSDVVVSDTKISPVSVQCDLLAPNKTCELEGIYTVTQVDKDAGDVVNVASVVAGELPKPLETTLITPLIQNFKPTLTKMLSRLTDRDESGGITAGDLLTFTVNLDNDGDTTLTQVRLGDDRIKPNSESCAKVLPGESCELVGSYKVTQADMDSGNIVNIATASMNEHPEGRKTVLNTPLTQFTDLTLSKQFIESFDLDENGEMTAGDELSYQILAENTGNVTLVNVVITDDILVPSEKICIAVAPGENCLLEGQYVIDTVAMDAGVVVNRATVNANNLADSVSVESKVPLEKNQAPTLTKTLVGFEDRDDNGSVTPGDTLTYEVALLNDGNVTLTNAVVSDPLIEPASKTCAVLLAGKSCDLVGTYLVTLADQQAGKIINTAEASTAEVPGPRQATLETVVDVPLADLALTKTIDILEDKDGSTTLTPGDIIVFTVTVFNEIVDTPTGDATGVIVRDKLQSRYSYLSDDSEGLYDPVTGDWIVGTVPLGENRVLRINAVVQSTGTFTNTAEVVASDSGDPDSFPGNDDGNQDEDDEAAAPPSPAVGLSVEVGTPVPRGNGNYTIAMSYILENTGIVSLCELRLLDDLGATFGSNNVVSVTTPVTAGTLVPNSEFDGVTDLNLLVSDCDNDNASRLPAESDAVVKIVVEVMPTSDVTLYEHNARVEAKSSDTGNPLVQIPIFDISTAGPDPDPNKNNNAEEDEPNVIELVLLPSIDVGITASAPIPQQDGRYLTALTLLVANQGNLGITDIDLLLPLGEVFQNGFSLAGNITADRGSIVVNNLYDGIAEIGLFDADASDGISSHLAVGEAVKIELPVLFAADSQSDFELSAVVTALSSVGLVTDRTLDDVDAGVDNPTVISTTPIGVLGAALSASPANEMVVSADPSERCEVSACQTSLSFRTENVGNMSLSEIQIEALLGGPDGLPDGTLVTITRLLAGDGLSGGSATVIGREFVVGEDEFMLLLDGSDTLAIGRVGTVSLDLTFRLPSGTLFERFEIAALASAIDASGVIITDLSNNGSDIDSEGDGPGDNKLPTPLIISSKPIIGVLAQAKSDQAGNVITLLDGGDEADDLESRTLTYGAGFQVEVANLGNTELESVEVVNSLVGTFPTLAADPRQPLQVVPGSLSVTKTTTAEQSASGVGQKRDGTGRAMTRRKTDLSSAVNLNFDGINDVNLVDPGKVSLALGETIVITYDLEIQIDYSDAAAIDELQQQNFETQIVANGTDSVSGHTISDLSDDAPGIDLDALDFAELRNELDGDGDFDPNESGENTPTALQFPTAIQGLVCLDVDADGICTDIDTPLEGWTVNVFEAGSGSESAFGASNPVGRQKQLLDANGEPTSVLTDARGYYSIASAASGSYRFEFVSPFGAVAGMINGTGFSLKVLNVPTLVLDPRGMIYDSVTGEPIGGAMLTMADAAGNPLPEACFAVPAQQNQITGGSAVPSALGLPAGAYEFSIQPGAAAECPVESTQYRILLNEELLPEGYSASKLRLPEPNDLVSTGAGCTASGVNADADLETPRCEVSQVVMPVVTDGLPAYYVSFKLEEGSLEFVNNHIPLDPPLDGLVLLTKTAVKDTVTVGEMAPYNVRVENLTQYPLLDLELIDTQAAGFGLAARSLRLTRAGTDGIIGSEDDVVERLSFTGTRPITLNPFDLSPRETVMVSYVMRVGAGVERGLTQNVVIPVISGQMVGNRALATIEVVADPLFDLTAFIGKVFNDANENGIQDEDELGLPGVRIATVGGEWITTDGFGRFSLPGVDPGENRRGRNAILKVDPASLPKGSQLTTENPRVLRITGGLMNQFDFGVKLPAVMPVPKQQFKASQSTMTRIERVLDPVLFESGAFQITEQYLQQLKRALARLEGADNLRIVLEGHTDNQALSIPSIEHYSDNLGLSKARVAAVAAFLSKALGLPLDRFAMQGYGDQRPAAGNDSESGMALNRRVEIRLAYDETQQIEIETMTGKKAVISMGETYFDGTTLRESGVQVLSSVAEALSDASLLQVELHIPNDGAFVSRRALILSYFHGLSTLTKEQTQKVTVSSPTADPSMTSALSNLLTRWAIIALNVLIPPAFADTEVSCLAPTLCSSDDLMIYVSEARQAPMATLGTQGLAIGLEGKVWHSAQPARIDPRFALSAPGYLVLDEQGSLPAVQFWMDTNFPDQISSWTLHLFDARDQLREQLIDEVTGQGVMIGTPVIWQGNLGEELLRPGMAIAYSLTLTDFSGHEIEVRGGTIDLLSAETEAAEPFAFENQTWLEAIGSENHLVSTDLNLTGDLVTIFGAQLPVGATLMIGNARYPVGNTGLVSVGRQLPPGRYDIPISLVDGDDVVLGRGQLPVTVDGDYFFMVGLADLTTGKNDVSGNIELLSQDAHYDGDIYVDGRVAFYLKGQIQGKYLVTAQLDTGEDDVSAIFSDIDRNDPRRLFKRIDPDRLYPVYGDDSRVTRDVDTQGKFYARLDWDRSDVLWGNYNTGLSGTELSPYNRSLYGFKLDYRSTRETALRQDRHTLKAFVSEPNTKAARDELVGTGGSLYYLSHADLVLGSAKIMVEVRDRKSRRVREQIELLEGQDYEIDPFQGRIILTRPLRSTASLSVLSIIREAPLDGDEVVLVVDYEYINAGFASGENVTAGLRGKTWLGDHIAIGGTYVSEDDDGTEFEIKGMDVTFKAAERTYLVIEQSETRAGQDLAFNRSLDGGLGYKALTLPGIVTSGQALSVTAQVDLQDVGAKNPGQIGFWYRNQDAGFNSLAFNQTNGNDLMTYGIEAALTLSERLTLNSRIDHEERGSDTSSDDGGIQLSWRASNRIRLAAEYLKQRDDRLGLVDNSSTLGTRLSIEVNDRVSSFLNVQSVLEQSRNSSMADLIGVGVDVGVTEKIRLNGEIFSDGDHDGARVGLGYRYRDNSSAYLNYVTERGNLVRDGLTLGQKTTVTDRMSVYSEHRFDRGSRQSIEGDSYGIHYRFTEAWAVNGDLMQGETQNEPAVVNRRTAYSIASRYRDEQMNLVNRMEYRVDDSATGTDRDQWVLTNRVQYRYSDNWVLVGKADYSKAIEKSTEFIDARFAEVDFGLAYRPVDHNRLNFLAMASYVYDVDPRNQMGGLYVDEKGSVLSLEGLYQLTPRLRVGGKFAMKRSAIRLDRDQDDFINATTSLWIARARYHMIWKLDALFEYRQLKIDELGDQKQGALLGIDVQLGPNMGVGVGYNFTDFNDRLTTLDYESKGWFLNLNGRL